MRVVSLISVIAENGFTALHLALQSVRSPGYNLWQGDRPHKTSQNTLSLMLHTKFPVLLPHQLVYHLHQIENNPQSHRKVPIVRQSWSESPKKNLGSRFFTPDALL